jgi:hypothetical protein
MKPLTRRAGFTSLAALVLTLLLTFVPSAAHAATGTGAISVSASTVAAGSTEFASGSGFYPNSSVNLSVYGGISLAITAMADASGAFSNVALAIPGSAPQGVYTLTAMDTYGNSAATTFTVTSAASTTASLTLNPTTVAAGQPLSISGAGFAATSSVTVSGIGAPVTAVTSASGAFQVTLTVQAGTANGAYTIVAQDGAGHSASATLTVTATSTVSTATLASTPGSGAPGTAVTVSGAGFTGGEAIMVSLSRGRGRRFGQQSGTQTFTAASDGTFSGSYTIPSVPAGQYTLLAVEQSSNLQATASLTVTDAAGTTTGSISLSSTSVVAGQSLVVSGSGFTANASVTVSGIGAPVATITSASGTFQTSLTVPVGTATGTYTIVAQDAFGVRGSATLNVTATSNATASLSLSSTSVVAGQSLVVTGNGFTANASVTVSGIGSPVTTSTSATGTFQTSLTVPAGTATGAYTIVAQDTAGVSSSATLSVTAGVVPPSSPPAPGSLTISASSARPGALLTIAGAGFSAGERIRVSLSAGRGRLLAVLGTSKSFTAASDGTFSGSYRVPMLSRGQYTLFAVGQTSHVRAKASLTIQALRFQNSRNQRGGGLGGRGGR